MIQIMLSLQYMLNVHERTSDHSMMLKDQWSFYDVIKFQNFFEFININRLRQIIIHSRSKTFLNFLIKGISRCSHNLHRRINLIYLLSFPYFSCCLISIHNRHVAIHKNDLIASFACLTTRFFCKIIVNYFQGLLSIRSRIEI